MDLSTNSRTTTIGAMNPRSRRLCFTVGTGLLTASLSIATTGCNKKNTVNTTPPQDGPIVNTAGPQAAPPAEDAATDAPSDDAPADDGESTEGEGEAESPE